MEVIMKGWLIVNGFLRNQKFKEIENWILQAAIKQGIQMELKTNESLLVAAERRIQILGHNEYLDFALFWDKDIRLAKALEIKGVPVFNSSNAIEICDDKSLMHILLAQAGIRTPKTIIAPMTYQNIGYTNYDFLKTVKQQLSFPIVVKECFGSFGKQVYLCHTEQELYTLVEAREHVPFIFQEFINTSFGKDLRLQVVGKKVIAAMYRYSENGDFRANITNGGKMKHYEPTKEQQDVAIQCCEALGLDFAGVDLLFGENEKPIVCEVNSNAHFKNIYDCTKVNTADFIMQYIKDKLA